MGLGISTKLSGWCHLMVDNRTTGENGVNGQRTSFCSSAEMFKPCHLLEILCIIYPTNSIIKIARPEKFMIKFVIIQLNISSFYLDVHFFFSNKTFWVPDQFLWHVSKWFQTKEWNNWSIILYMYSSSHILRQVFRVARFLLFLSHSSGENLYAIVTFLVTSDFTINNLDG